MNFTITVWRNVYEKKDILWLVLVERSWNLPFPWQDERQWSLQLFNPTLHQVLITTGCTKVAWLSLPDTSTHQCQESNSRPSDLESNALSTCHKFPNTSTVKNYQLKMYRFNAGPLKSLIWLIQNFIRLAKFMGKRAVAFCLAQSIFSVFFKCLNQIHEP